MDEPLAQDLDERFRAGCSTHNVTFTGAKRSEVNAALEAHVAEYASV
jgi:hypothetical protein